MRATYTMDLDQHDDTVVSGRQKRERGRVRDL